MRYKPPKGYTKEGVPDRPSKRKIKEAHKIGEAGFLSTRGKGKKAKGVNGVKIPTVRITSSLLSKLQKDGSVGLGYEFTDGNRKTWIDKRPTEVQVGSVDFDNDVLIKCGVSEPVMTNGVIVVLLTVKEQTDNE